jgi:O-acetylhomoserine/O-acetylserine sulfhydrylase
MKQAFPSSCTKPFPHIHETFKLTKNRDNTPGAAGFLLRPIDHGVDIVIASTSQYISISGSPGAGIIIDSGKFPWTSHQFRFPQFFTPAPGFHGLKLYEKFGNTVFITFARIAVLRDIGPCLNPFESFQLLAGLETLVVRVERMCENAGKLAGWLAGQEKVEGVRFPGLGGGSEAGNRRYLKHGYGGLLSFTLKSGVEVDFGGFKVVSLGQR